MFPAYCLATMHLERGHLVASPSRTSAVLAFNSCHAPSSFLRATVCLYVHENGVYTRTVDALEDDEWKTVAKSGAIGFASGILL